MGNEDLGCSQTLEVFGAKAVFCCPSGVCGDHLQERAYHRELVDAWRSCQ